MFQTLTYDRRDTTALITLARPEALNALNEDSGRELVAALEEAGRDETVRAVVLTGRGKAFSAGGDVRAMRDHLAAHPGQGAAPFFFRVVDWLNRSVLALRQMPKPVLAAVNGVAAGGGLSWVLASDIVLAAPQARFDTAYIRIAVSPDGGNTLFLPRLLGPWRAAELFFLGQAVSAEEGQRLGFVNRLVPAERLVEEALALAAELARRDPAALARTKALINATTFVGLAEALERERQGILASAEAPAFEAAIQAFFSQRR
jgi:2-(1,2-epoxy-1,2-dihydrophenyl)acetyl-CoA isomerase